jgi:hypothetical protein
MSRPTTSATSTARLLAGGIVAGPLFLVVWLVQALTRDGYDPTYHPLSLLSLGDLGWIQIANFVVTGGLFLACAIGMRQALAPGRGIGMIVSGVFVTDPGAGFPPGAPAGPPAHISWHGILHEVGFAVAALSWLAACFVFRRRFAAEKRRGWVVACTVAPVADVVVSAWPDLHSLSLRLVIGTAISSGFVAALAVHLIRARLSRAMVHTTASAADRALVT